VTHYIVVRAVTETTARQRAVSSTRYAPAAIGSIVLVVDQGDNSRQREFIFETANDVAMHPLYTGARLANVVELAHSGLHNAPTLVFGPEVTVGG